MILLPLVASAHDIEIKNADGVTIYYNYINDGTELEVTYRSSNSSDYSKEYQGNVVLPEEVTYMNRTRKVTSIGYGAFSGCSGLTSVTIPNSVTSIGEWAFGNCSGLTSITIPNSVTRIGANAFEDTQWYNDQNDGLIYVGKVAYKYKGNMPDNTKISIREGTVEICGSCFSRCSSLTSVTIPNSVTSIGAEAFYGCSGLKKVIVKDIAAWCGIKIDSNPLTYAKHLYSGEDTEITNLIIPNSVTSIGYSAFSGCSGLTSVTIPNSVTSIGGSAFSGCSGLTSVTIPNSVTSIGTSAFDGCSGLKKVIVKDIAAWCGIKFVDSYTNPLTYAKHLYSDEDTEITLSLQKII